MIEKFIILSIIVGIFPMLSCFIYGIYHLFFGMILNVRFDIYLVIMTSLWGFFFASVVCILMSYT